MKIAIYTTAGIGFEKILESRLSSLLSDADLHFVRSIVELERKLRNYHLSDMVILLEPDPYRDMQALYRLQELLRSARLLILLPSDCSTELLTCAHSLFPRYLCFRPDDVMHLGSVIQNLCDAGRVNPMVA